MKNDLLLQATLYVVLDTAVADFEKLFVILEKTLAGGTKIVQIRDKRNSTAEILSFVQKAKKLFRDKAIFIVNDDPNLALLSGADGVHVGQEDLPLKQVREICGNKIIGVSCQTLEQAKQAQKDGADYVGFGSVFKTKTKPDRQGLDLEVISQVMREIRIPVFFIGGITAQNVSAVLKSGGKRIAVTRAVCEAQDVVLATQDLLKFLRG